MFAKETSFTIASGITLPDAYIRCISAIIHFHTVTIDGVDEGASDVEFIFDVYASKNEFENNSTKVQTITKVTKYTNGMTLEDIADTLI